jgi:hypothetical protein
MFFWAIVVSAYMIISYRNKVKADKNLAKVNWWTGFLWASVIFTIYYFIINAGLTR